MPRQPTNPAPGWRDHATPRRVLHVVLIYALFSSLWILGSDSLLGLLVSDARQMAQVSLFKGWAFVGVTSVLLYGLMRRLLGHGPVDRTAAFPAQARGPLAVAVAIVVALTAAALVGNYRQLREQEASQIEAVAALRANQIEQWLRERRAHAQLIRSSSVLADMALRVLERGEAAVEPTLQQRLGDFGQAIGAATVFMIDTQG